MILPIVRAARGNSGSTRPRAAAASQVVASGERGRLLRRTSSLAPRRTATRAAMLSVVVVQAWGRGSGERSSWPKKRRGARIGVEPEAHTLGRSSTSSTTTEPGKRAAAMWAEASRIRKARACDRGSPKAWIESRSRRASANFPPPTIRTGRASGRDARSRARRSGQAGQSRRLPPSLITRIGPFMGSGPRIRPVGSGHGRRRRSRRVRPRLGRARRPSLREG